MYLEDGENLLALACIPVAAYDAAQGPGASTTHTSFYVIGMLLLGHIFQ
jgi:hypothetical protein